MDFILHNQYGKKEHFSGNARYTLEAGFLIIYTDDGRRLTYSGEAWTRVEEMLSTDGSVRLIK